MLPLNLAKSTILLMLKGVATGQTWVGVLTGGPGLLLSYRPTRWNNGNVSD